MDIRTYRAGTMQEALALVRRDLGPQAVILGTRELKGARWLSWLSGSRQVEVTASSDVNIPSRLPNVSQESHEPAAEAATGTYRPEQKPPVPEHLARQITELQQMVENLCRRDRAADSARQVPEQLFELYTDLIEADFQESLARDLVEWVRSETPLDELGDIARTKERLARMIEGEIRTSGPIECAAGQRKVVALVGPTGVGKTTTIAKLAANYRLREKANVGLITVDTYRIAAVEQLRTYADIIDLPMKVVATPREMRQAIEEFSRFDLVLLDTAGRSPRDEVKIQELKAFLNEAEAEEVHLVLSGVASSGSLQRAAEHFAAVGTNRLVITKLDEASGLGNLLPVLRQTHLPLSYVTNGQQVPDDIEPAQPQRLARAMLGMESMLRK